MRSKSFILAFILFVMAIALLACEQNNTPQADNPLVKTIVVEGDVENGFARIEIPSKNTKLDEPSDSKNFHGISLATFLSQANPSGTPVDVYIMSADGFVARVNYDDADELFVINNTEKDCCIIAPKHPISAQAQEVSRMVVVSEHSEVGLNIILPDGSKTVVSKGRILISPLTTFLRVQGSSQKESKNEQYSSSVLVRQYSAPLADLYEDYAGEGFVVLTKDGGKYLSDGEGAFVIGETRFDYIDGTGDIYEDIEEIQLRKK